MVEGWRETGTGRCLHSQEKPWLHSDVALLEVLPASLPRSGGSDDEAPGVMLCLETCLFSLWISGDLTTEWGGAHPAPVHATKPWSCCRQWWMLPNTTQTTEQPKTTTTEVSTLTENIPPLSLQRQGQHISVFIVKRWKQHLFLARLLAQGCSLAGPDQALYDEMSSPSLAWEQLHRPHSERKNRKEQCRRLTAGN